MTDLMGSGGDTFFIWDRAAAKFVSTSEASEEQMRLYGRQVYTSSGSGNARVMTVFDPQGEPTSYAVAQSTRRGELVPASRAAGRAGVAAQRRVERAAQRRSDESAVATAAVKRGEIQTSINERRAKIEALQVDVQNETLWQQMNQYTKELLYGDPTLLEGVNLVGVDMSTVMDYVWFGTPSVPGLFEDGVSNEYVFVRVGNRGRFKNAMFATEEERMNSKIYTREEAIATGTGQFEPIGETLRRQYIDQPTEFFRNLPSNIRERRERVFKITTDPDKRIDQLLPDGAIIRDATVPTAADQPFGTPARPAFRYNPDVLGPWITSNYESLSPTQRQQIDDIVEFSRDNYNEEISVRLSPEEQRMVRGRGFNPWDGIDRRTSELRVVVEQRAAAPTVEQMTALQQTEARRFAGRYGAQAVSEDAARKSQFLTDLALSVEQTISNRYLQYEFTSVPLGFSADEFVRTSRGLSMEQQDRLDDLMKLSKLTPQQNAELLGLQMQKANPQTVYMFRETAVPYTRSETQLINQSRAFTSGRLLSPSARAEAQTRVTGMARSAERFADVGKRPLTEGQAMSILRDISRNPVEMAKLKQQLVGIGADDKNFINDTAVDPQTVRYWTEIVVPAANNAGVDPRDWLRQVQLDPSAQQRLSTRSTGSGAGFTIRLPSTDDVATIVQDVSQRRIGQRIDSEQAKQIAQAYVQMAESQYRSQQGATTITEPMSAETFAQQQISSQMGDQEMLYQTGLQLDTLIDMIGG